MRFGKENVEDSRGYLFTQTRKLVLKGIDNLRSNYHIRECNLTVAFTKLFFLRKYKLFTIVFRALFVILFVSKM